jgi:hypothetical protein
MSMKQGIRKVMRVYEILYENPRLPYRIDNDDIWARKHEGGGEKCITYR